VHGLNGAMELPDWPALTLAEVDGLLRGFPQAGEARRILSVSPRPFSAAGLVETAGGQLFVKRHARAVRDREGLLEEHRLLKHLADRIPELVQAPVADGRGESAIEIAEWTYEVFPVARGEDVYREALSWTPFFNVEDARAAGRALARLHQANAGYEAPAREARQLVSSFKIFAGGDRPVARMEAYLDSRPLLRDYVERRDWRGDFERLLMPFYAKLEPWVGGLKPLWTHNDFHASNLMWSGDGAGSEVRGIIDFGLADRTNAVHDLATAIERNVVEWLRAFSDDSADVVHGDQMIALLDGYEEIAPLSYEEGRVLVAMLPLVHCEFALSETDYFLSVLGSREKAYFAYEGYFLRHAEWFSSSDGKRLLAMLEGWVKSRPRAGVRA
jgi:Ser/Thr protein kinase RdoA (MazF antagonist)